MLKIRVTSCIGTSHNVGWFMTLLAFNLIKLKISFITLDYGYAWKLIMALIYQILQYILKSKLIFTCHSSVRPCTL